MYNAFIASKKKILSKTQQQIYTYGTLRLLLFGYAIISTYFLWNKPTVFLVINLVVCIALFLYLVSNATNLQNQLIFLTNYTSICADEIKKKETKFHYNSPNFSAEYINAEHAFSADLDIFGADSLFQYIQRTCTALGKKRLAIWLQNPFVEKNKIENNQLAVKEFHQQKLDWCIAFLAKGTTSNAQQDDVQKINNWLDTNTNIRYNAILLWLLPIFNIGLALLVAFDYLPSILAIVVYAVQLAIATKTLKNKSTLFFQLSNIDKLVSKYIALIQHIEQEEFTSSTLQSLKESLFTLPQNSFTNELQTFKKLLKIASSSYTNSLVNVVNTLLCIDVRNMQNIQKWKNKNAPVFKNAIQVVAEIDALISLALYSYQHAHFVFPEITEGNFTLHATALAHPLIPQNKVIANDFTIEKLNEIHIITGANMAGKSTFLRTVGVNLVLAMIGAPVCASRFRFTPIHLFTSMRATDSLNKNDSYFLAEIKRLQVLLQSLEHNEPYFIILDEILMGTNSQDKLIGSKLFIEKLIKLGNTSGLFATHDLQLTELEKKFPQQIVNNCFEASVQKNNTMYYDYTIKKGVVTKMNALDLMQQLGLIHIATSQN